VLYEWIKALHVISIIAWMAGMLYLPRLFVYHCGAKPGSVQSETFKVMERRLLRAIINPAMIASFIFGIWLLVLVPEWLQQGWLHAKLLFVFGLGAVHGMLSKWRRDFDADRNTRSAGFYRVMNEVPTVLMIGIVIFVIVKPF
jgi:TIGR00701 family protein